MTWDCLWRYRKDVPATRQPEYIVELLGLADEFRGLALLPPEQAMMRLGELTDRAKTRGVDHRVKRIRRLAAEEALRRYGTQIEVAKRAGADKQLVWRVLKGKPRVPRSS